MDIEQCLKLNIRGRHMLIDRASLNRYPNSKLALLNNDSPSYVSQTGEHYFNTNSAIMETILDAYNDCGGIYFDPSMSCLFVQQQLSYWGLDASILAPSYRNRYFAELKQIKCLVAIERSEATHELQQLSGKRGAIYRFLEKPKSGVALVWYCITLFCTALSVYSFMIETELIHRQFLSEELERQYINKSHGRLTFLVAHTLPKTRFLFIELVITTLLLTDLTLKFLVSPSKMQFFNSLSRIADILGVIPLVLMFILLGIWWLVHLHSTTANPNIFIDFLYLLNCARLFRISRFVGVLQRSRVMRILQCALRQSLTEVSVLAAWLLIATLIFGNLVFFAEMTHDSNDEGHFGSAFDGVWWAIVTLTQIGYGDFVPMTILAKCFAGLCMLFAVLNVGLAVAVFTSHFLRLHSLLQCVRPPPTTQNETSVRYDREAGTNSNALDDTDHVTLESDVICQNSNQLEETRLIEEDRRGDRHH